MPICLRRRKIATGFFVVTLALISAVAARAQAPADANAPVITKVEPPNWWVGLTTDVLVLLSGKNLQATHAQCNLPEVVVSRTQSSANGDYLFVWLTFAPQLKSGTAVCRIVTPRGNTSFEFPLAARKQILGRNQGLSVDDVIYLIMPDRFADGDPSNDDPAEFPGSHDRSKPRAYHGGDLRGIEEHLSYLKDLGVTTLWLTPVVKNGGAASYHGYGAVDLYNVDPHLGTLADYQKLVDAAHRQHMKIFFDIVPNHVGPQHPWVKDPPMPDWFHGTPEQHLTSFPPFNGDFYGQPLKKERTNDLFEALADPHATPQMRKNLTEGWFFGVLPDMNTENPLVIQYLSQNSVWWAEATGLDGYRIDTFPYISRAFWAQWHQQLRRLYPRLSTVGEVFHPDPVVTSFYAGGRKGWDGIDTQLTTLFDFPMYFAMREVLLNGAPAGRIANVLRQDALYPHPDFLVPFFGNHDTTRFAGAANSSPERLKLAFGLALTIRGIPEIYYGDEIGMPGGGDPDNRRDFPGGWPEDANNAFKREGRTAEQQEVFEYVQTLLRLRRDHDALRGGKLWHLASDETSYVFLRESDDERLIVAFHTEASAQSLSISLLGTPGETGDSIWPIFGKGQADRAGRQLKLDLPPQSVSIFVLQ